MELNNRMSPVISIIDYGVGNIGSICNIIRFVGGNAKVISSADQVSDATTIIFPGVGVFDHAMKELKKGEWVEAIHQYATVDKKPFLGICLGMQLLTRGSQEGVEKGLGIIEADTIGFLPEKMAERQCIPHMGWDAVNIQKDSIFFNSNDMEERFYFAHSYHVVCDNQKDVLTTTNYGYEFVSSFQKDNIVGVQFHPEKSHRFGQNFFKYFIENFAL